MDPPAKDECPFAACCLRHQLLFGSRREQAAACNASERLFGEAATIQTPLFSSEIDDEYCVMSSEY